MATYTFKGTKVTGTSEVGALTPNAKRNDTYLNVQTGHVYRCTEAHETWARWSYWHTDIIAKPRDAVYSLSSPTRDGNGSYLMKAKWTTSDWQKNSQNGRRMTNHLRKWQVNTWIKGKHYPLVISNEFGVNANETSIRLSNFTVGNKSFTRDSFYPLTKRILTSVTCTVYPKNDKGLGPKATASRSFDYPRKPVISAPTFNDQNGQLSFTITTNAGNDYRERYDTRYKMTVVNTRVSKKEKVVSNSSSTSTQFTVTYDAQDYMQMNYEHYIKVKVEAWSRGFRGDSPHVTRTYYISYPAQASILRTDISSESSTGKCTVRIKTNSTTAHPVDRVKLEYLPNVDYAKSNQIPGDAVWSDTNIVDDAECTALSVAVTELIPERGKYTWIRIKSWHASENRLYRYSAFKSIMHKSAPTAADDDIVILSAEPAQNGKSIVVQLGWNASGDDDSTGTELTWSDELDTWESTKEPETHNFTWSQGAITVDGVTYHDSAKITIKGLKEGELYYIKARRYLDGDIITYSPYSDYASCVTSEIPDSIVANCDRYISVENPLPVYWTFSGNGVQTRWQVEGQVDGADESIILAEGEGSTGFAQISYERLLSHVVDNSLNIRVGASTGSDFVWSDWRPVTIIEPPTLSVDVASELTVQPMSFSVTASAPCKLLVIVSSEGASGQYPTGVLRQTVGDTIFSDILEPEWAEGDGVNTASITIPTGLDFWNLGNYSISVTAIDDTTGLRSDAIENKFSVNWAHTAADPFDAVTLTPIDETDDTGMHRKAVQIDLTAPSGSSETDVYDIYRLSGDGAQLIGEGFPLTHTTVDEYAPFGDDMTHYYRVAIRTVDGDVNYADFEYNADGDYLRLDWEGYYFESPYSVAVADSYKKSVDIRNHMGGSVDGYWNSNIVRKGRLNTDVIKLIQPNEIRLARQLARYAGAVLVRTPDGSVYEADVQVTDLSIKNRAVYAIALDATEIGLTQEFMLPVPISEEEEEEEESE